MNRGDFIALIQNPGQATPAQLHELEKVVAAFPYCQTAHLLLAKAAHDQKAMLADQKLKLAAAYAIDRNQLRVLIHQETTESSDTPETSVVEEIPVALKPIEAVTPVITPVTEVRTDIPVQPEIKKEVKVDEPITPPKDPAIAEMISHREKLMEELELKLQEIKRNREKFQQNIQAVEPVKEVTPVVEPIKEVTPEQEVVTPVQEVVTPVHLTPEAPETTVFPVNIIPVEPVIPVIEITPVHPIESILSAVEEKNKTTLPADHDELPDTVKAMYETAEEPIHESTGIHVLDEILRMDEKQQLQNEDLSIFRKPKTEKKNIEEVNAEIPTPLPPLPIEDPNRLLPAEHPVKREQSLVPLNLLGKLEGYIASDNDTENNSVNQEQAGMLSDYLDFINNKRLRNRRDPRKVDAIIDRFIKDEPIISRLDKDQAKEEQADLAEKSYIPPPGLISENFARILLSQGKKDKAIKVYEELILKNPEKKDYFALLIEQIRKGE